MTQPKKQQFLMPKAWILVLVVVFYAIVLVWISIRPVQPVQRVQRKTAEEWQNLWMLC